MTSEPLVRILVVDDHPIVRQGYAALINNQPDLVVCGTAATEQEALEQVTATAPALAIVDITLKDSNGIELAKDFHSQFPSMKVLVISAHDEQLFAERALDAGAAGYINKQEATERLVEAIRTVLSGDIYVSDRMTRRLLQRRMSGKQSPTQSQRIHSLTDRELQVYELIGQGRGTKQIAEILFLSAKTIERYKENIKQKLGLKNATELVQNATRWIIEKA